MGANELGGSITDLGPRATQSEKTVSRDFSKRAEQRPRHAKINEDEAERQIEILGISADNSCSSSDSSRRNSLLQPTFTLGQTTTLEPTATSEKVILAFAKDDPQDPYNWSTPKKIFTVSVSVFCILNSTLCSGLASNSAPYFGQDFGVTSNYLLILPTSLYLVGYVVGPILWAPMSEQYGRRWIMISAFALFTIWSLASALAPNLAALTAFRFLSGVGAACPIVVVGGTCADIYRSPEARGKAMTWLLAATTFGPTAAPAVSGYISPALGWRWSFWIGLILAGVTFIPLLLVEETYGPILLKRRAERVRKQTGKENICAPIELEPEQSLLHVVSIVLTRPIRMFFFEAIVLFSCLYMAFAYGIFYMFFQAFPIIYEDTYGFTAGQEGLTFLAIGVGASASIGIYFGWDAYSRRARARGAAWTRKEEMRRLPLACIAGPFLVISCFWLGWSARSDVHWIVPVLSGVTYGIGYLLIFMALLNYLVDAYKIFAASAMAASSMTRSLFGAILPFAARPMYKDLGVAWACSLLGLLSLLMAIVPFIFVWKGEALRARSEFCQYLLQREAEEEEKRERRRRREVRRQARQQMAEKRTEAVASDDVVYEDQAQRVGEGQGR